MEIIDAHAHIYPDKIAEKASQAIGVFYNLKMDVSSGTCENLIANGSKAGISRYVVHSCATKHEQVRPINEFVKKECELHKEFLGFMTLHQDLTEEQVSEEVDFCIKNGFHGIKLHPDFQKFDIDSPDAEKFYRVVGDRLPFLFHTGDNRYTFSAPEKMASMAKKYKNVTFIGAHFGGYRCWDRLDCYKGLDNVYFDTSSALDFIGSEKAKELINKFGAEKYFFGTDFPMWDATEELKRFLSISLSDDDREKILAKNIKNLLKLQ